MFGPLVDPSFLDKHEAALGFAPALGHLADYPGAILICQFEILLSRLPSFHAPDCA